MRIGPLGIVSCTWQNGQVDQQHPKQQQQQPYEQQLKHQHQRLPETIRRATPPMQNCDNSSNRNEMENENGYGGDLTSTNSNSNRVPYCEADWYKCLWNTWQKEL